ncbi:M20/M25/M40 family metallo-hydrolase [Williamsia sp. MIQD14]|uniref:M20/M25/M40 family metallo-hydrolase n=1 Tax=Williamsia sp. MIQD14 TaxID=3425703 RepID=UPI003DA16EBF
MAESIDVIRSLIGFDTTSSRSNLDCLDFVHDYLDEHGVSATVFPTDPQKANLIATVPGRDGATTGGILLSGHVDVVPAAPAVWTATPFDASIADGRIIGRGAADMKAFCGIVAAWLTRFAHVRPRWPVHFLLTHDEETGCAGAHAIAPHIEQLAPRVCVVGEPTGCEVATSHRGCTRWSTTVRGVGAHTSDPALGVNAVHGAVALLSALTSIARENADRATVTVTSINGGTAENVVPDACTMAMELRCDSSSVESEIEAMVSRAVACVDTDLRAQHPQAGAEIHTVVRVPPLTAAAPDRSDRVVSELIAVLSPDETTAGSVRYGTEAGIFQRLGVPTVLWGPGSIDQAHTVDEYIEIAQIETCVAALDRLSAWLEA